MRGFVTVFAAVVLSAVGAQAQDRDYRVAYGDLTLASPSGAAQFDARVRRESRRACAGGSPLERQDCARRFRDIAMAELPAPARQDYAEARGERRFVMAQALDANGMV